MLVDVKEAQRLIKEIRQAANDLYDEAVKRHDLAEAAGRGGKDTAKQRFEEARDRALEAAENWHKAVEQLQKAIPLP